MPKGTRERKRFFRYESGFPLYGATGARRRAQARAVAPSSSCASARGGV